ncbi:MAG: GIY-YIG nuclease family protein [Candidatus Omnitrophica bacterium]|nr:GIY-YIG nuclease family protein [Candidatus Omnitrophota bacterium]
MNSRPWSVYIVKCADGKFYTGISNDVSKRVATHNKGQGCRFTRFRHPVELVYCEQLGTKSAARKRELEIQEYSRSKKLTLISNTGCY